MALTVSARRLSACLLAAFAGLLVEYAEHGIAVEVRVGGGSERMLGRTFYVDPQGDDNAAGTAPGTAWRSVSRVNVEPLRPGDSVLFKRGGKWRGESLRGQAGSAEGGPVTYGAFGDASKARPTFLGSVAAGNPSDWREAAAPAPVGTWVANISALHGATYPAGQTPTLLTDVGNIILGGDKKAAHKVWDLRELNAQDQFFYNFTTGGLPPHFRAADALYFFSPAGNPATVHGGLLECALMTADHAVIKTADVSHVVYDSLAIRYGGADGMYLGNASHVAIRNFEVSWIGGGCLTAGPRFPRNPRECTRFGNGIEFSDWSDGAVTEHNVVERTRLWEIYDAALSPQGGGKYVAGQRMYTQRNISFHHNIIGHAEYCFEIWSQGNTSACAMQHVRFDNNLCLDSGGGWSHTVRPDPSGRNICSFENSCNVHNISYQNNIFFQSRPWDGGDGWEAGWWMSDKWGRFPCAKGTCGWEGLVVADHNLWYAAEPGAGPLVKIGEGSDSLNFFTQNFSAVTSLTGSGRGAVVGHDPRLRGLSSSGGAKLSASTDVHPLPGSPAIAAGVAVGWVTDFDGKPIPSTGSVDIGPYQS